MVKLMTIYLGFLLIKAIIIILPKISKSIIIKIIPRSKYTTEEIIACGHMRPDLYYEKQFMRRTPLFKNKVKVRYKLKPKDIITLEPYKTNTYKEVEIDINVIRENFKRKMKNKELTRSQILAIRNYLESIINCKEKKFANDCHCIYYCLKQLDSKQMLCLTTLANLLK